MPSKLKYDFINMDLQKDVFMCIWLNKKFHSNNFYANNMHAMYALAYKIMAG